VHYNTRCRGLLFVVIFQRQIIGRVITSRLRFGLWSWVEAGSSYAGVLLTLVGFWLTLLGLRLSKSSVLLICLGLIGARTVIDAVIVRGRYFSRVGRYRPVIAVVQFEDLRRRSLPSLDVVIAGASFLSIGFVLSASATSDHRSHNDDYDDDEQKPTSDRQTDHHPEVCRHVAYVA